MELNPAGVKVRQFFHAKFFFARYFCGERWLARQPICVTASRRHAANPTLGENCEAKRTPPGNRARSRPWSFPVFHGNIEM